MMAKLQKKSDSRNKPKKSLKSRLLQLLSWVITFGLLYWIFFVKLPSEVDISDVWSTVGSLTLAENFLLLLSGLLTIVAVGWTAATVLPGLPIRKGTQASAVGQLTSVALPPPVDMVIRFGMYKTYGFPVDKSAIAVVVAGIARYFTVVAIPLIGLAVVILTGEGKTNTVLWFVGGSALFLFALWLMHLILSSTISAKRIGKVFQSIANWVRKLFRKKPNLDIQKEVVDFGSRTRDVAVDHFKSIALSNIVWGLSCFLVFWLAIRFCGIDASIMSTPYILLIAGSMLLLNSIPITPGGIGVSETVLLNVMTFPSPAIETAFTAALFVYRVYTWLLPMPVGVAAYVTWRHQVKNKTTKVKK